MLGKILLLALVCSVAYSNDVANYTKGGKDWTGFCKNGSDQSPISIEFRRSFLAPYNLGSLLTNFTSVVATGDFTDQGLCVQSSSFGNINFNTQEYIYNSEVTMVCFHAPSQHKFNGRHFALEVTLVSGSPQENFIGSAVSVLFKKGKDDSMFIEQIMNVTKGVTDQEVDLNKLVMNKKITDFYNYYGSITIPPCTEGVNWFVTGRPQSISKDQLEFFTSHWAGNHTFAKGHGNNRNVQKYRGRQVYLYRHL